MSDLTFNVPGMTCGHCENAVKTEVGSVKGVANVAVDLGTKVVTVTGEGLDRELFEKVQKKREIAAIIQKYRREYHDNESAPEALRKIVAAQKEMRKLDDDMAKIADAMLAQIKNKTMPTKMSSSCRRGGGVRR